MTLFINDYSEGCHERILEALTRTNRIQTTVRVSPSLHTASASIEDWQNVEWGQGIITY